MRACLCVVAALGVASCHAGTGGASSVGLTAGASTTALQKAGWQVHSAPGGTASRVTQTGFLELGAPDGSKIDVQFISSPSAADSEYHAALRAIAGFQGTVQANAIVFSAPLGATPVRASDIALLDQLLR